MRSGEQDREREVADMGGDVLPPESIATKVQLTPIESTERIKTKMGLKLCLIVIIFIGLESLIMMIYFFIATHSLKPMVAQAMTEETVRAYAEARRAVVEDVLKMGNLFLGSVMLPILTLLLGYMFGSRSEEADTEEED